MFTSLDFVYMPSRDVASEMARYAEGAGAEIVFAIERFGTRVAMLRLTDSGPAVLLAQHLHGEAPVLVFRVPSLHAAAAGLGMEVSGRFEIPHGEVVELETPGPQRIAIYELTRPERAESILGRKDF